MALKRQIHCVCDMKYHIILVTKYRRPVLQYPEVTDLLKEECRRIVDRYDGEIIETETDTDHIHLLLAFGPDISIRKFVNTLKATTSYWIRKDYNHLISKYLCGNALWSESYYAATCGSVTVETLKKYVESQPTKKRERGNPAWKKGMESPYIHKGPRKK